MEQEKKRKNHLVKWLCCVLAILLVGGVAFKKYVKPKIIYHPQPHTNEELLTLFEENRPLFDEVAQIFYKNDRFWNDAKRFDNDPYDTHIRLDSPDERKKMKLFTEEEQKILRTFFETVGAYRITLDLCGPSKEEMEQNIVLERPDFIFLRISCNIIIDDTINTFDFIYKYGTETKNEADEYMESYARRYDDALIYLDYKWYGLLYKK